METFFILLEMHLFSSQFLMAGPYFLCCLIHRCILGDDRAKQAAAASTNGTEGIMGSRAPIKARTKNRKPRRLQTFSRTALTPAWPV